MPQRILITGGAGFIGSHLARRLVAADCEVVVADQWPTIQGTLLSLSGIGSRVPYHRLDVTDADAVAGLVSSVRPHLVVHLAAQPISVLSNRFPAETLRVNVEGTRNTYRAANDAGVAGFILASSACRYGIPDPGASPLREDDRARPGFYCYSESKQLAEAEISVGHLPRVVLRFVNIYGPGDRHFSRIVPKLIRSFLRQGESRLSRGTGDTILDYVFVDDAVEALLAAATYLRVDRVWSGAEAFNIGIGGNHPVSIRRLAGMAAVACGVPHGAVHFPHVAAEPTMVKYLDPSKANGVLGWYPRVRLPEGLRTTAEWYRRNLGALDALEDETLPAVSTFASADVAIR